MVFTNMTKTLGPSYSVYTTNNNYLMIELLKHNQKKSKTLVKTIQQKYNNGFLL